MRSIVFLVVLLVIMSVIQAAAQFNPENQMAQQKQKPTIAVTTFENLSAYPENAWVAMSFSEALTVKLKRLYERFIVVERLRVYEVIREQGFDPEKADSLETTKQRDVGSLMGANYLILGSVSLQGIADDPKTNLLANMRTVDVQTGEIKEAASISGQMQEIFDLEIQLAYAFLQQVGVDPTREDQEKINIKETTSLLANKYYNLGQQAYYEGDYEAAKKWYDKALELLEGKYYQEAELSLIEILKRQKQAAEDEEAKRKVIEEAHRRRLENERKLQEAYQRLYANAEYLMIEEKYAEAISYYQQYLQQAKPFRLVKWQTKFGGATGYMNLPIGMVKNQGLIYVQMVGLSPVNLLDMTKMKLEEIPYSAKMHLNALNAETGELKWKFEADYSQGTIFQIQTETLRIANSPVIAEDTVYCLADKEHLYAIDAQTGELRWQSEFEKGTQVDLETAMRSRTPLMAAEGLVFLIKPDEGVLLAISADTGEEKWRFETKVNDSSIRDLAYIGLTAHAEVINGTIYIETHDGFSALAAQTGEVLWNTKLKLATQKPDEKMEVCIQHLKEIGSAIKKFKEENDDIPNWLSDLYPKYLQDANILLCPADTSEPKGSKNNTQSDIAPYTQDPKMPCSYVYEFSPLKGGMSGDRTWKEWKTSEMKEFGDKVPIVRCWWHGDRFLNLSYESEVYESSINWRTDDIHRSISTMPIVADDGIYIGASDGIYVLHRRTGNILNIFMQGTSINSLAMVDGLLYTGSRINDSFYALKPQTGEIKWESKVQDGFGRMIAANGKLCYVSDSLTALDSTTGETVWQFKDITSQLPLFFTTDKSVYISAKDNKSLYSLAAETGEILWQFTTPSGITYNKYATAADGTVYLLLSGGQIYALNPKSEEVTPGAKEDVYALLGIGRAHIALRQYQEALEPLEKALASRTDFAEGYRQLAIAYEGMKSFHKATANWSQYLVHALKTGEAEEDVITHLRELAGVRWVASGGKTTITENGIYGISTDGSLFAKAVDTGRIQWRLPAGSLEKSLNPLLGSLTVADEILYVVSWRVLFALQANTGELKWKFQIESANGLSSSFSPTVVVDGIVYIIQMDRDTEESKYPAAIITQTLCDLSAETGKINWKFETEREETTIMEAPMAFMSPPHILVSGFDTPSATQPKDFVYWRTYIGTGYLYALAKDTGQLVWKFETGAAELWEIGLSLLTSLPPAAVIEGTMYVQTKEYLYALEKETGKEKWKKRIEGVRPTSPVVATDETIYIHVSEQFTEGDEQKTHNSLYALRPDTGEIKWKFAGTKTYTFTPPVIFDGTIYLSWGENLYALFQDTGEIKWKLNAGKNRGFIGVNAVTDDTVYLMGTTTAETPLFGVVAVKRETGEVKWRYDGVSLPIKVINGLLLAADDYLQGVFYAFDLAKIEQLLAEGKKWWE